MSSSNVIKSGNTLGLKVSELSLEPFADLPAPKLPEPDGSGFVHLLYELTSCPQDREPIPEMVEEPVLEGVPEESPPIEAAPPGISEEEMIRRMEEAFDRGFEEGKGQAERGLANVFKSLRDGVASITDLRERVMRESEETLMELSILIARKIIHQEISIDRRIIARVVAAAVNSAPERDEVVVRLNPEDYRLVSAHKQHYLGGLMEEKSLLLKPDESIACGGCIVDTDVGEIDARVETQLDEIFKKLMDERNIPVPVSKPNTVEKEHHVYQEN